MLSSSPPTSRQMVIWRCPFFQNSKYTGLWPAEVQRPPMQPELNRKPVSSTVSDWRIGETTQANSTALAGNPDSCFLELPKGDSQTPLLLSPLSLWQNPSPYDPRTNDNCYAVGQQRQGPGPPRPLQSSVAIWYGHVGDAHTKTGQPGVRCHGGIQMKGYWVPSREEIIRTRFTGEARTDVGPETTEETKRSLALWPGTRRGPRWRFIEDGQRLCEDPDEKGTHERSSRDSEGIWRAGLWSSLEVSLWIPGTCLGFKWWKCRPLKAAEQREHRPLRGQRSTSTGIF